MNLLIAIGSIIVIAGIAAVLNRLFAWKLCPLCAGAAGTWLWMIGGIYGNMLPRESWQLLAAVLMGGTIVGILYQLERKRHTPISASVKVLLFLFGYIGAYGLLQENWIVAFLGVVSYGIATMILMRKPTPPPASEQEKIKELEERMKQCC